MTEAAQRSLDRTYVAGLAACELQPNSKELCDPMRDRSKKQNVLLRLRQLASRFRRDESGNYLIIMAVAMPALVGAAGLGAEEGIWLYRHQLAQSAADAAAISAATAYGTSSANNVSAQANAVAASYGFVDGKGSVAITVNQPPKSGASSAKFNAVEVIVTEKRDRLLSSLFGKEKVNIKGRAVALANAGLGCLLSLDATASDATNLQGNPFVNLVNCSVYDNSNNAGTALNVGGSANLSALSVSVVGGVSGISNITTSKGITTGAMPAPDPFAGVSYPSYSGCGFNNKTVKNTQTLDPGVYCNGLQLNAGAYATLNPGVYYMDRGSLQISGGATIKGSGVTIVFTSSTGNNYATATINGGATVDLTAPTSGSLAGIVMFGDRNMPVGTTFKFNGGAGQNLGGAVYFPHGTINYAGGSAVNVVCTELIGDIVSFVGNSTLSINCAGYGTKPIGSMTASLAE
jgi:Flp pilus assembly protein TadG